MPAPKLEDSVKIIADTCWHGLKIGTVREIIGFTRPSERPVVRMTRSSLQTVFLKDEDYTLIPKMTIKELLCQPKQ